MRPRRGPDSYLLTMLIVVLELPIIAVMSVGALLTRAFAAVSNARASHVTGAGAAN
jgi:hypothetical protein